MFLWFHSVCTVVVSFTAILSYYLLFCKDFLNPLLLIRISDHLLWLTWKQDCITSVERQKWLKEPTLSLKAASNKNKKQKNWPGKISAKWPYNIDSLGEIQALTAVMKMPSSQSAVLSQPKCTIPFWAMSLWMQLMRQRCFCHIY